MQPLCLDLVTVIFKGLPCMHAQSLSSSSQPTELEILGSVPAVFGPGPLQVIAVLCSVGATAPEQDFSALSLLGMWD